MVERAHGSLIRQVSGMIGIGSAKTGADGNTESTGHDISNMNLARLQNYTENKGNFRNVNISGF